MRRSAPRNSGICWIVWMVPLMGSLVFPGGKAMGECKDAPATRVRVSVLVVLASEKNAETDKKLEEIAREVRKTHPRLKGFRMVSLSCKSLPVGRGDSFDLVEDQKAEITVERAADKEDRVRLKVEPPQMGAITYSAPCGKFLPILTRTRTANNEQVLIAIRVQPCQGK
ncbi:MAG: hypothetical protein ACKO23_05355 [Gemmataceae bacterium]